jgi:hypothetical protein
MSALEIVLALVVVTVIATGAYLLLLGGDRRQRKIESERIETLEHVTAPGVIDFDPTHFRPQPNAPEAGERAGGAG